MIHKLEEDKMKIDDEEGTSGLLGFYPGFNPEERMSRGSHDPTCALHATIGSQNVFLPDARPVTLVSRDHRCSGVFFDARKRWENSS